MQRYELCVRYERSAGANSMVVIASPRPNPDGEWVRLADLPGDTWGNEGAKLLDAVATERDTARRERDISRRDARAAEERYEGAAAERDTWRGHYDGLAIQHAARGRVLTETARERDAALKLAEERSLAAGRAEEALLAEGRVIQALNVQCEAEKVTIADLQSELRAWQRSDRLWRKAALEAQKQLREARQASPTRVLPSPPGQPLHITETEEWQRGFKLGMKLEKKDGLDEAGAPSPDGGWSYDMESAPRGERLLMAFPGCQSPMLVHWKRDAWLTWEGDAGFVNPYAWRRAPMPPQRPE